ncbi:MAG: hypothetical protein Q8P21_00860 [bacterium]|nr:hypothetical protein [bacterium]
MTHFLGGLALGVFVIGLFNLETRTIGSFLTLFVLVMITGVLWEWIEYVNDIAVVSGENYALDTIHDIVMDALGAITAYFIILRSRESF